MKLNRIAALLGILTLATCVSCAKVQKPDGMPDLYPCTVTLTQGGEPLEGALIHCQSDDPKLIRWAVTGQTDAKGVAKIFTMGKYEGAPAGTFAVVVTKEETEGAEESAPTDIGEASTGGQTGTVFSLVSLEFTTKETTPLRITVEANGDSKFDLDCGEKTRVERPKEKI